MCEEVAQGGGEKNVGGEKNIWRTKKQTLVQETHLAKPTEDKTKPAHFQNIYWVS